MGFGSKKKTIEPEGAKTVFFKVKGSCDSCGRKNVYKLKFTGKPGERYKAGQIQNCQNKKCRVAVIVSIDVTVK